MGEGVLVVIPSVPASLKGYEWRVERIWAACADWLKEDEFDRLEREDFGGNVSVDGPVRETSVILWPRPWLVVVQEMGRAKMLMARRRKGRVEYRRAKIWNGETNTGENA